MPEIDSSNKYSIHPKLNRGELPDPFMMPGKGRIKNREEWPECADAWMEKIIKMQYGKLPPEPEKIIVETLCRSSIRRWPSSPILSSYRINCHGGKEKFSFCVKIVHPDGTGPFPAVLNGDYCWWYAASDKVAKMLVESGYALVLFNRTEMAADLAPSDTEGRGGLYRVYPEQSFAAISAWAWGYHRCVDFLYQLPFIDKSKIAATGHSRGGKTTLLAGATDKRITLVNDNAAGCAGGASSRFVGHDGETLTDISKSFPFWFSPEINNFIGREDEIPFDQHCLLAAIAPRPLLQTYALDDRWSNPEGMVQCAWAAGKVYEFLGAPGNLAFHLRPGGHSHSLEDWTVLLDFIACKWFDRESAIRYNSHPYKQLQPAFKWKAPNEN